MAHSDVRFPPAHRRYQSIVEPSRQFCIVRDDQTVVPLVPVDQLPFQLQELPRQTTYQEALLRRWDVVDNTSDPPFPYHVKPLAPPSSSPTFLAPDHQARSRGSSERHDLIEPLSSTERSPKHRVFPREPHGRTQAAERLSQALNDSIEKNIASVYATDAERVRYTPRPPPPSGVQPDKSKKEFCTHWIRFGECDYETQGGCLYKHVMPDKGKLRELTGAREYPKWWQDKNAIKTRPLTWMEKRNEKNAQGEDCNTSIEPDRASLFKPANGPTVGCETKRSSGSRHGESDISHSEGHLGEMVNLIDLEEPQQPGATYRPMSPSDCDSYTSERSLDKSKTSLVPSPVLKPTTTNSVANPRTVRLPSITSQSSSDSPKDNLPRKRIAIQVKCSNENGMAKSKHSPKKIEMTKARKNSDATSHSANIPKKINKPKYKKDSRSKASSVPSHNLL
ncbi:hypothetical protein EJ04DRAFT_594483 [Polyplosphaeria fusca]|uniref:C3H1-type domain-containing protein n=1 Tax=Polyplosphaeria fusca TaxID=682080 RepID=A0A9P4V227_9PLEO|nr:hypothetical protein EJ04DRAFT_594483 [Polyplosphaeria fusca]